MTAAFNLSQFANKVNTSGQASLTTAVTGVLPAANGGTGLSSPGTSGNILQSNGTAWVSSTIAQYIGNRGQAFTANGTFTIPTGVTAVKVTVVGGGGSGSAYFASCWYYSGGGGGGGGTAIAYLTGLTPGNTLAVTIGAGGAINATWGTNGNAGGTSSVASGTQTVTTISATGGGGAYSIGLGNRCGGSGGVGSGGTLNIGGSGGASGTIIDGSDGGKGGSSTLGGGGWGVAFTAAGPSPNGGNYGGGGGGGVRYVSTICNPGAGASGVVIFEW